MYRFAEPVTLVGGAPILQQDFEAAAAKAPTLIAVDGGADQLASFGATPALILGDMDSMRSARPEGVPLLKLDEQDTVDFEKCLLHVDAPLYLGLGFLGRRLDHTLAAMHVLTRHADTPVILISEHDVVFAAPKRWRIRMPIGTRVSFYPIAPAAGVSSAGLKWPIEELAFAGGAQIGTSNETTEEWVSAEFDAAGIVTILPRDLLSNVIDSLTPKNG